MKENSSRISRFYAATSADLLQYAIDRLPKDSPHDELDASFESLGDRADAVAQSTINRLTKRYESIYAQHEELLEGLNPKQLGQLSQLMRDAEKKRTQSVSRLTQRLVKQGVIKPEYLNTESGYLSSSALRQEAFFASGKNEHIYEVLAYHKFGQKTRLWKKASEMQTNTISTKPLSEPIKPLHWFRNVSERMKQTFKSAKKQIAWQTAPVGVLAASTLGLMAWAPENSNAETASPMSTVGQNSPVIPEVKPTVKIETATKETAPKPATLPPTTSTSVQKENVVQAAATATNTAIRTEAPQGAGLPTIGAAGATETTTAPATSTATKTEVVVSPNATGTQTEGQGTQKMMESTPTGTVNPTETINATPTGTVVPTETTNATPTTTTEAIVATPTATVQCIATDVKGRFEFSGPNHLGSDPIVFFGDNIATNADCPDVLYVHIYGSLQLTPETSGWLESQEYISTQEITIPQGATNYRVEIDVPDLDFCWYQVEVTRVKEVRVPPYYSGEDMVDYAFVEDLNSCKPTRTATPTETPRPQENGNGGDDGGNGGEQPRPTDTPVPTATSQPEQPAPQLEQPTQPPAPTAEVTPSPSPQPPAPTAEVQPTPPVQVPVVKGAPPETLPSAGELPSSNLPGILAAAGAWMTAVGLRLRRK